MWLIFALCATFSWAAADLFYKKAADPDDEESHVKTVVMVGLVMGIYAFSYMAVKGIRFSPVNLIFYLPVSSLYILSMIVGFIGLRYIELSIASPVQNSSGVFSAILIFFFFGRTLSPLKTAAVILISIGIIALGIMEKGISYRKGHFSKEEEKKYRYSFPAFVFPVMSCVIDGVGTFADAAYLDELSLISEDNALLSYEFTFFICALAFAFILKKKKVRFAISREKDRGAAAFFETIGQFFYVYSMSRFSMAAAPLIASYSAFSVLLSRIFLNEKLTRKQYIAVAPVIAGIIFMALPS